MSYFHASPIENRESILAHGIDHRLGDTPWRHPDSDYQWCPPANYLFGSEEEALAYSGHITDSPHLVTTHLDLYEVDVDGLALAPEEKAPDDLLLRAIAAVPIRPERLRLIRTVEVDQDAYARPIHHGIACPCGAEDGRRHTKSCRLSSPGEA